MLQSANIKGNRNITNPFSDLCTTTKFNPTNFRVENNRRFSNIKSLLINNKKIQKNILPMCHYSQSKEKSTYQGCLLLIHVERVKWGRESENNIGRHNEEVIWEMIEWTKSIQVAELYWLKRFDQTSLSEKEKNNWEGSIKSSSIGLRHSWAALSYGRIPLFLCNALSTFHSNQALPVTPTLTGH